jgi:hypothetical protein
MFVSKTFARLSTNANIACLRSPQRYHCLPDLLDTGSQPLLGPHQFFPMPG